MTTGEQQRFYLRDEVVINNSADRAWVIIHGNVFDVTPLFDGNLTSSPKKIYQLLLAFAGKDLSDHFDRKGRPVYRISKDGVRVPEFPPVVIRNASTGKRWWNDKSLIIGKITAQERKIRVINNLTFQIQEISVCEEDTIADIQRRFCRFNANAKNYTWRINIESDPTADLRPDKTLTENGVIHDRYPPAPMIWIFYQIPPNSSEQNLTPNTNHEST
ncbi:AAEL013073-PA [Aedes aegypti]|uniref:Cytochrome b5 domain-containing protein 1 n=2 Tax=Aedes aegypti TaxID=7159 RepID=Q16K99_AEDAE|nr:cytochrome b5 domain-containing protein 1 [Aedes aegypti]EAT34716.1 AAEL013073-PA [Aedes aegypti]